MNNAQMAIDKTKLEAQELHVQILANGQMAATALLEFARGLKEMRDKRLYQALGYADFSTYAEQAVGIRQRQAYSYISTLERLGAKCLEQNAGLGISKLQLLAEIPAYERESFALDNDLASMSVAQIKAKIKEADDRGQQLDMLGAELADAQACEKTYKQAMERLEAEKNELVKQLAAAQKIQPPPAEPDMAAVEEIRREIAQEYIREVEEAKAETEAIRRNAQQEQEKAVALAVERTQAEANRTMAKILAERDQQAAQKIQTHPAEQAQPDDAAAAFRALFERLQDTANQMADILDDLTQEGHHDQAARLQRALHGALAALMEQMEEQ